jgi:hypothetical protein
MSREAFETVTIDRDLLVINGNSFINVPATIRAGDDCTDIAKALWKYIKSAEQSKQAEIDQLRAELEKAIMDGKLHKLRAEDADAFEMWLDDQGAPKYSHEEVNYSLIGRTMRLLVKLTKTD